MKFSIIMPAYNAEKYIAEAIESVKKQTCKNWELVIVDDGSTDNTASIVEDYKSKDSRIIFVRQANSGTAASARNTALKYITGEYVQMLDADDLISSDLLEKFESKLQMNNYDVLIPNCVCFDNDEINNVIWEKKAPKNDYFQVIDGETGFKLSLNWTIHGIFLVNAKILKQIKYDPTLLNGDEFTTRKLLYNAKSIGFIDSYYFYRRNMQSTTKSVKNRFKMYECLTTFLNIYNYAKDNKMEPETVKMCSNLLVSTFCGYSKRIYELSFDEDDKDVYEYAMSILSNIFDSIDIEMWNIADFKYRFFFHISKGDFNRFMKSMRVLSRLWRSHEK